MIVRILSEGQYNLPGAFVDRLNEIDNEIVDVVGREDREAFRKLLGEMLDHVRSNGSEVPIEELVESDVVLPEPDITLEEAAQLFTGEGVVPD